MFKEKTSCSLDENFAPAVAHFLHRPGFDLAFVLSDQKIYYARFPQGQMAPSSAVVKLLQNIFEMKQDLSFFVLRNKIYTTAQPSERDRGMVKVLAKKVQFGVQACDFSWKGEGFKLIPVAADEEIVFSTLERKCFKAEDDAKFLSQDQIESELIVRILSQERGSVLHDYDRPIAAALVDSQSRPILWALNSNRKNKSLHAEINLLQTFYDLKKGKVPLGYSIFVTHKPCKMCAGMIVDFCEAGEKAAVHYLNEVTGSLSRWTALDVRVSKNLNNS